jgi:hypothetical protein
MKKLSPLFVGKQLVYNSDSAWLEGDINRLTSINTQMGWVPVFVVGGLNLLRVVGLLTGRRLLRDDAQLRRFSGDKLIHLSGLLKKGKFFVRDMSVADYEVIAEIILDEQMLLELQPKRKVAHERFEEIMFEFVEGMTMNDERMQKIMAELTGQENT